MADILLFGPHAAGKTQLCYTLKGLDYNDPQQTGKEDYSVPKNNFWGWIGFSDVTIQELGGKDLYLYDKKTLRNAFSENKKLCFVFNGNDLIKELQNYQQGGYITSLLRCYVIPALEDAGRQQDIFFIATHKDEYGEQGMDIVDDTDIDIDIDMDMDVDIDMKDEIYKCLEKANEEYLNDANGTRYPFKKLLRGNLFCVDATNSIQVKKVFDNINNS